MTRFAGLRALCTAGLVLIMACAEVQSPPGGEADKSGPTLLTSSPAAGSLEVPRTEPIILRFSERIQRPATGSPVFISPRPARDPRVRWHGDRVEISFADSLESDQTYIVSLNAAVADLRGNKLDSAIEVAFSTGASIDSGRVTGTVFQENNPKGGVGVALYPMDTSATRTFDSLYPAYFTVTNAKGEFVLSHLPRREFQLLAFIDKNNDGRFRPVSELFALPDRRIIIGEQPFEGLTMSLTSWDTLKPEIIAATYTPDHLVRLRLSKAISLADLKLAPSGFCLLPLGDTLQRFPARSFVESDLKDNAQITGMFDSLSDGLYRAELTYNPFAAPLIFDSLTLKRQPDKTPPAITTFAPEGAPVFARDLRVVMAFSEPLDTTRLAAQSFTLWQGKATPLTCRRTWEDPFHLAILPDSIIAGTSYRLDITEPDLMDLSGNALGDTLKSYSFATLDEDSLGSVSGAISITLPDRRLSPVVMTFKQIPSGQSFPLTSSDRQIRLALPAGKYLLSGFIDTNKNGRRELGSIDPFTLSESYARYPDTVAVRARFETTGLDFEFR